MSKGLKLGAISYLNAEPLVWPLENGAIAHPHTISRALPAELVEMLADGRLDCAVAPIGCLLNHPGFVPIPDVAIACRGPVASVLLFHNKPIDKLHTIWLDPASRTSNLLIQIMVKRLSRTPCMFKLPTGDEAPPVEKLPECNGRLMIGDRALKYANMTEFQPHFTDLGELWRDLTGHPFTFARWIAAGGEIGGELRTLVREARDWSLLHLHELINPLAEKYDFEPDIVDRYLRVNITYMHGPRELAGEREFFIMAEKFLKATEINSDA